jgi:hypothetical protein
MPIIGKQQMKEEDYGLNIIVAYRCSLVGANLERADLRGKKLRGANFTAANLRGADLSFADLRDTTFVSADLSRACLYQTNFAGADLSGADLTMSYGKGTNFHNATANSCLFRNITYKNALFINTDLRKSDFFHAELLGSRFNGALTHRVRNMDTASFEWWISPWGGPHSYSPRQGWLKIDSSMLGNISLPENSAGAISGKMQRVLESFSTESWFKDA